MSWGWPFPRSLYPTLLYLSCLAMPVLVAAIIVVPRRERRASEVEVATDEIAVAGIKDYFSVLQP
jgi:hypothetical protein